MSYNKKPWYKQGSKILSFCGLGILTIGGVGLAVTAGLFLAPITVPFLGIAAGVSMTLLGTGAAVYALSGMVGITAKKSVIKQKSRIKDKDDAAPVISTSTPESLQQTLDTRYVTRQEFKDQQGKKSARGNDQPGITRAEYNQLAASNRALEQRLDELQGKMQLVSTKKGIQLPFRKGHLKEVFAMPRKTQVELNAFKETVLTICRSLLNHTKFHYTTGMDQSILLEKFKDFNRIIIALEFAIVQLSDLASNHAFEKIAIVRGGMNQTFSHLDIQQKVTASKDQLDRYKTQLTYFNILNIKNEQFIDNPQLLIDLNNQGNNIQSQEIFKDLVFHVNGLIEALNKYCWIQLNNKWLGELAVLVTNNQALMRTVDLGNASTSNAGEVDMEEVDAFDMVQEILLEDNESTDNEKHQQKTPQDVMRITMQTGLRHLHEKMHNLASGVMYDEATPLSIVAAKGFADVVAMGLPLVGKILKAGINAKHHLDETREINQYHNIVFHIEHDCMKKAFKKVIVLVLSLYEQDISHLGNYGQTTSEKYKIVGFFEHFANKLQNKLPELAVSQFGLFVVGKIAHYFSEMSIDPKKRIDENELVQGMLHIILTPMEELSMDGKIKAFFGMQAGVYDASASSSSSSTNSRFIFDEILSARKDELLAAAKPPTTLVEYV